WRFQQVAVAQNDGCRLLNVLERGFNVDGIALPTTPHHVHRLTNQNGLVNGRVIPVERTKEVHQAVRVMETDFITFGLLSLVFERQGQSRHKIRQFTEAPRQRMVTEAVGFQDAEIRGKGDGRPRRFASVQRSDLHNFAGGFAFAVGLLPYVTVTPDFHEELFTDRVYRPYTDPR